MWFDKGELDAVKDEVMPEMEWLDLDRWKQQAEFNAVITPNFCPACRDIALTKIQDRHSATEVDLCPRCRGTWLGTGQFLNLVNALLDEADRTPAPDYAKISLQKAKELLSRPESIPSEWQDFRRVLMLLKKRFFVENPTLESILVGLQKSLPL
jgi:Zn-finger nucleic acid-binding protein